MAAANRHMVAVKLRITDSECTTYATFHFKNYHEVDIPKKNRDIT
jgi:hypothetical protein